MHLISGQRASSGCVADGPLLKYTRVTLQLDFGCPRVGALHARARADTRANAHVQIRYAAGQQQNSHFFAKPIASKPQIMNEVEHFSIVLKQSGGDGSTPKEKIHIPCTCPQVILPQYQAAFHVSSGSRLRQR
eukprot:1158084-Pelagomonas_calceolata.AAC.14